MEGVFPLHTQIRSQACYLSPSENHQRLVQDLDSQVFVAKTTDGPFQTKDALTALLRIRYGGGISQWHLTEVHGGALVVVPPWLNPDDLIHDSYYWERGWDLQMLPWQCIDHPIPLLPLTRVRITIWDFPIEYWNLHYFKQVTTSMGIIEGFARRHEGGRDKKGATIFLHCADLNLIPYSLTVVFNGGWICCKVDLHGRPPLFVDDQLPPPPPQPPDLAQPILQSPANTQLRAGSQVASRQYRNILRWRVRDTDRAPAPAASVAGTHIVSNYGSNMGNITTCPQKILQTKGRALDAWHCLALAFCGKRGIRGRPQRIRVSTPLGEPPNADVHNKKQNIHPIPDGHLSKHNTQHSKNPRDPSNGLIYPHKKTSLACHAKHHTSQNPKPQSLKTPSLKTDRARLYKQNTYLFSISLFLLHLFSITPNPTKLMEPTSKFTDEDEALIRKFIRLHTEEQEGAIVKVPLAVAPSTCWEKCLMVKLIFDRLVADSQLASAMLIAWGGDPQTTIR